MTNGGYYKTHRKIFKSDLWQDIVAFRLFMLLIGRAAFQDGVLVPGTDIILKRGQYVRSLRKLAEDLEYRENKTIKRYSKHAIENALLRLERAGRVLTLGTDTGTLFTIVKYEEYQRISEIEKDEVGTDKGKARGQSGADNDNAVVIHEGNITSEFSDVVSPPQKQKFSEDDLKAAEYIFGKIYALNPKARKPNLEAWANDVRLMVERDNRTHREICEVFAWANQDSFWQSNILSTAKLRQQFDRLVLQMKNGRGQKPQSANLPGRNIVPAHERKGWSGRA